MVQNKKTHNKARKSSYTFLFGLMALTLFVAACATNVDTTDNRTGINGTNIDDDDGGIIRDDIDDENRSNIITGDVTRDNATVNRNATTTNRTTGGVNDSNAIVDTSNSSWRSDGEQGITAVSNTSNGTSRTSNNNVTTSGSLMTILDNKLTEYTVEYEITANNTMGSTNEQMEQIWIQSFDLPNFVTVMIDEENEIETRTIYNDSVVYSCTNFDDEWTCLTLSDVQMNATNQLESEVINGSISSTYLGTCLRAGESGEQYRINADEVIYDACYTTDGILLELETENVTMYATRVRYTVDMNLFELPAEPQTVGGVGNVGTQ